MKTKTTALAMAVLMLLSLLTGCGTAAQTTDAAQATAEATAEAPADATAEAPADAAAETTAAGESAAGRTFTVGFDAEFPPFGFIADDGSYDGFDLACAQEVCDRLGWTFVAQPIDWDAKDAELSSGNIDCIWNGFTLNGREDDYTWSQPYYDNSIVVVVRADSGITSLADLAGKTVMVQAASSGLAALEDESNADLYSSLGDVLEEADYNTGFMDLGQGTVDAVVVDVGVANYQLASSGDSFVVLDQAVSSEQYAIGFLKGNTELEQAVESVMEQMAADGTLKSIGEKYVNYGLVVESICLGQ